MITVNWFRWLLKLMMAVSGLLRWACSSDLLEDVPEMTDFKVAVCLGLLFGVVTVGVIFAAVHLFVWLRER